MVQRPSEAAKVQQPFRSAVEGNSHAIEQVDDARGRVAHALHRRLVREQRVAQDIAAFCLPLVAGSVFGGWATVRPESDADDVERRYLDELDRLASAPVADDELARARALIEASELGALGRVEEVADRLSMYAALFDRPEMINEQLPRYLAVTADQIRDVAREVLRPDNRVVLTYVPAASNGGQKNGGK